MKLSQIKLSKLNASEKKKEEKKINNSSSSSTDPEEPEGQKENMSELKQRIRQSETLTSWKHLKLED